MAAAAAGSQAALPGQRHVRAAQAWHPQDPTCCILAAAPAQIIHHVRDAGCCGMQHQRLPTRRHAYVK
jgi:hypothetical protein